MNTIKLQGIGERNAIPSRDLKPGQIIIWNYGYTSEVLSIQEVSKCYILLTARSNNDGNVYERKFKKSFLIAIK